MQIVAIAYEARIQAHPDGDIGVASLAASRGRMSCPAQANVLSVVDPGRDVDVQLATRDDPTLARAPRARALEHTALADALRACPLADELAEDVSRDPSDHPGAATGGAGHRSRVWLGACAVAPFARLGDVDRHGELGSGESLLEIDLHECLEIPASGRLAIPPSSGSEQIVAEKRRKDVRDGSEVRVRRLEATASKSCVPEPVVGRTPFRIGEDLVGLRDLAKPLVRLRRLRDVRVQFSRQSAKRLLDLGVSGVA